jgi:RimJ/RimL family protein N-acetyltransferase
MAAITIPLATARLYLQRPVEADADAIIAIVGDFEVARWLARIPHPYTKTDLDFFMSHLLPNEPTWAIELRETHELIGMVGLTPAPDGQSAELGYYLARHFWGRGIATEAARAITEAALGVFGYRKLTSGYHMDNPASGRVLRKLGFRKVGTSIRPCLAEGRDKPSIEVESVP